MTRYTQEDTLSTYLDLGRNSAIIFIADRAFNILEHKYYTILISSHSNIAKARLFSKYKLMPKMI